MSSGSVGHVYRSALGDKARQLGAGAGHCVKVAGKVATISATVLALGSGITLYYSPSACRYVAEKLSGSPVEQSTQTQSQTPPLQLATPPQGQPNTSEGQPGRVVDTTGKSKRGTQRKVPTSDTHTQERLRLLRELHQQDQQKEALQTQLRLTQLALARKDDQAERQEFIRQAQRKVAEQARKQLAQQLRQEYKTPRVQQAPQLAKGKTPRP